MRPLDAEAIIRETEQLTKAIRERKYRIDFSNFNLVILIRVSMMDLWEAFASPAGIKFGWHSSPPLARFFALDSEVSLRPTDAGHLVNVMCAIGYDGHDPNEGLASQIEVSWEEDNA